MLLIVAGGLRRARAEAAKLDDQAAVESLRCEGCDLVLISLDTVRADHLGAYGYSRPTSPHLDAFAEESVIFENAHSTSYHTADSHMSVFTGLYPSIHRVRNVRAPDFAVYSLAASVGTLPEALSAAGYRTAAFTGGGNVSAGYGFERGFDRFEVNAEVDAAMDWLQSQSADDAPRFLFFHTYGAHDPYLPEKRWADLFTGGASPEGLSLAEMEEVSSDPSDFRAQRDAFWGPVDPEDPSHLEFVAALYDAGIREVDEDLGRLLAAVADRAPGAVVVIFSDHGEEFHEHGQFLHGQLYEELLHVPLVLRLPGLDAGRRVPQLVSLVDLAPTLLDVLAVPGLDTAQGRSLLPLVAGQPEEGPRQAFAEKLWGSDEAFRSRRPPRTMTILREIPAEGKPRLDKLLLIARGREELYRLSSDPDESDDLWKEAAEERSLLARELRTWAASNDARREGLGETRQAPLDEQTRRDLMALGYLGGN